MTATDELRALLDGRGVGHEDGWSGEVPYTKWRGVGGMWFIAYDSVGTGGGLLFVHGVDMTPAQAVEATLGRGTCRWVQIDGARDLAGPAWGCSACGYETDGCGSEQFAYCPKCGAEVAE